MNDADIATDRIVPVKTTDLTREINTESKVLIQPSELRQLILLAFHLALRMSEIFYYNN